jgi:hypothetical protein
MSEEANFAVFRDCLSETINASIDASDVATAKRSRVKKKRSRKNSKKDNNDDAYASINSDSITNTNSSEESADFVEVQCLSALP